MNGLLTLPLAEPIQPPLGSLDALSRRERDVLASLAYGRSNGGIATDLFVSERTVECHLRAIMLKLDLLPRADTNRRVLAAAAWLTADRAASVA